MVEAASFRSSAVAAVLVQAWVVAAEAPSYGFAGWVVIVRVVAAAGHTLPAAALVDTLACSALPASLVDMSCCYSRWYEEEVLSRL